MPDDQRQWRLVAWFEQSDNSSDDKAETQLRFFEYATTQQAAEIPQVENGKALSEESFSLPARRPLKVFTDSDLLRSHLKQPSFILVDCQEEADILWLSTAFKSFSILQQDSRQMINQFVNENCLTVKDLLARTIQRHYQGSAPFLPRTYDLQTQLPVFIRDFKHNPQPFIVKPWNSTRGIDGIVSDDLSCIIRQLDTGPKVACQCTYQTKLHCTHSAYCQISTIPP